MARGDSGFQTTPRVRHIRHQKEYRFRKRYSRYLNFLERMGVKYDATPLGVRDVLQELGPFLPQQLEDGSPPIGSPTEILIGAGTTMTRTGDNLTIANATATFLTNGFTIGDTVSVWAEGPTWPDPIEAVLLTETAMTETSLQGTLERGGPPETVSSQAGDRVVITQILEDS
jgi:hypothetical protein